MKKAENIARFYVVGRKNFLFHDELKALVQKGGKGYRIRHAQILLKLDQKPENAEWTYDRIKDAYGAFYSTIAGVADELIRLEVVDYITDTTICEVMKKTKSNRGL